VKNNSGNSGEHKLSPENENLSPYFDGLSPVSSKLSPEENDDLSTKYNVSGDTGYTGDKLDHIVEDKDNFPVNEYRSINNACIDCPKSSDPRIGHIHPFYYCTEHPNVKSIYRETIEQHILYSTLHKTHDILNELSLKVKIFFIFRCHYHHHEKLYLYWLLNYWFWIPLMTIISIKRI
jgi:hypothetical protein